MSYNRTPNTVLAGRGLKQAPSQNGIFPPGVVTVTVDADIATTTSLGLVQIGSGVNVDANGIISVSNSGNETCNTKVITGNYNASANDCYIGVNLITNNPATLILPNNVLDGTKFIVKLQYGAPVGNRKLTIETIPPSMIDGYNAVELTTPYQSASFICQSNNWYLI